MGTELALKKPYKLLLPLKSKVWQVLFLKFRIKAKLPCFHDKWNYILPIIRYANYEKEWLTRSSNERWKLHTGYLISNWQK